MKQVLIIGYPFPLRRGGSPRLLGLAKYLPDFGWQPIILTAPLDEKPASNLRVIETPYRDSLGFWKSLLRLNPDDDIRRQVKRRLGVTAKKSVLDFILTRIGEVVNYPDSDKGWQTFAIKAGEELLGRENIDAIISSSAPVTAHLIARKLKLRHKIPWVADLRDLWTQNHNYSYSPLRKLIDKRLELTTLSTADALVTVSQPWADELSTLHKGNKVYAITNGFDPETVNSPPANLTDKFTITYTGTIYTGKQDPSKLFVALRDLISEGSVNPNEIEVRFYGSEINWLRRESEEYGLSDIVKYGGMVSQEIASEKQRESQVLLLLNWEDQRIRGVHPLKGFEYLAAQRPILATGGFGNDVTKKLLDETKTGAYCKTIEDVKTILSKFYSEYKLADKVSYTGDIKKISKYSHREMAGQFSKILNQLASKTDS